MFVVDLGTAIATLFFNLGFCVSFFIFTFFDEVDKRPVLIDEPQKLEDFPGTWNILPHFFRQNVRRN